MFVVLFNFSDCRRPNVTDHLTIAGLNTTYNVDSVIDYYCQSDYILEGYRSRVCLKSGQWSGSAPKCIKGKVVHI
jgi:hypothetical protein